jgi:hypothetical protein
LGGTYEEEASALDEALSCLKLKKVTLLSDASAKSQTIQRVLAASSRAVLYEHHMFAAAESAQIFVGRVLRPTGNRVTVLISSANTTKALLKGQSHMHIGGRGYANVLLMSSSFYTLTSSDSESNLAEGELLLAEEADMWATSEKDFYLRRVGEATTFLASRPETVKTLLDTSYPTHIRSPHFVLINLHNFTRTIVLRLASGNCSSLSPIYYLGGSLVLPANYSAPIPVSANFGQIDPPGVYLEVVAETSAAVLAFEEISSGSEMLPNFEIELWNFTGGITRFNASLFQATVMPYRDKFGAALLPSMTSYNTILLMMYLRSHGINTPFVGAVTTDDSLSSPTTAPGFVRVIVANNYLNVIVVQTLKKLG